MIDEGVSFINTPKITAKQVSDRRYYDNAQKK